MINVDIQDNHEEATLGAFLICELCQCVSREGSFGTQLTAGGLGVVYLSLTRCMLQKLIQVKPISIELSFQILVVVSGAVVKLEWSS